ncbi:MAG: trypsin-like peptidase domain-containing protein [Planctomycetota bacterium]|nr:trypsin-like peptidase domain-containing protein [Planctomycetota bacterium]
MFDRKPFLVMGFVFAFLFTFVSPAAIYAQGTMEEELVLDVSKTVKKVVRASIPRTVCIRIQVGEKSGFGSGAILTSDGLILSCAHVIEPGTKLTVVTSDGKEYVARKLGMNSTNDYGLIKIDAEGLDPFPLGDSDAVQIRDWVVALGHPGGPYKDLQPAVAVGRVRGKHKQLPVQMNKKFYDDAIKTDCPIFGGNSGGPLINLKGELIGINGAILIVNDSAYAVPINEIKPDIQSMKTGQDVEGRNAENMMKVMQEMQKEFDPADLQKMFGNSPLGGILKMFMGRGKTPRKVASMNATFGADEMGVRIEKLETGGTAEMGGLQVGDRLTKLGGLPIRNPEDVEQTTGYFQPGETTLAEVSRNGRDQAVLLTFGYKGLVRDVLLRRAFFQRGLRVARSTVKIVVDGNAVGYGVIIDSQGWVLTSERLVQGRDRVDVRLVSGRTLATKVVGREGNLDVALLRVENVQQPLSAASLGNSSKLQPGDWVLSGGSAKGPLRVGAVSATGRKIGGKRKAPALGLFGMFGKPNLTPLRRYDEVVQHDTNLSANMFGSGLFNSKGKLIGINVANFYRGSSYATPIHRVLKVLDQLKNGLVVEAPVAYEAPSGKNAMDMLRQFMGGKEKQKRSGGRNSVERERRQNSDSNKGFLGVRIDAENPAEGGVRIGEVIQGFPAAESGLKAGDVLTAVNGKPTPDPEVLVALLSRRRKGTQVELTFRRDGKVHSVKVTLAGRPSEE